MDQAAAYVTQREFDQVTRLIIAKIDDGFAKTHQKQDETNGRVLKAEKSLEVLNKARLIDRVDESESRLQSIEDAAKAAAEAVKAQGQARLERAREWSNLRVGAWSALMTLVGGVVLLAISYWLGLR